MSHSRAWGFGNPYHRGAILGHDANEVPQEEPTD